MFSTNECTIGKYDTIGRSVAVGGGLDKAFDYTSNHKRNENEREREITNINEIDSVI
jgi:hypothetical protein